MRGIYKVEPPTKKIPQLKKFKGFQSLITVVADCLFNNNSIVTNLLKIALVICLCSCSIAIANC